MSRELRNEDDFARFCASIGPRLRAARKAMKMTQREVAEKVGISTEYFGRLERGHAVPSVETLFKLSTVLGVWIGDVLANGPIAIDASETELLAALYRLLERIVPILEKYGRIRRRVQLNTERKGAEQEPTTL